MARRKKIEEQDTKDVKISQQGEYYYAHGRRKTATARVRLYKNAVSARKPGIQLIVNEQPAEEYFPGDVAKAAYSKPFEITGTLGDFAATVKVEGSGKSGQLAAVVHGLANALVSINPEFKPALRKAGLITRDPRAKERRKYGFAQKARKRKQSPKR